MNEYRAQKDRLEFEAMKRNPETAYLVDKESFDNRLDELGVMDAIEGNIQRAMFLCDRSAYAHYRDLAEQGYYCLLYTSSSMISFS